MAANYFGKQLAEMVFNPASRPGKYVLAYLKQKIEKEFQNIYYEQMLYQGAFLNKASKYDPTSIPFKQIKQECDALSIPENIIYNNGEFLEKTSKILLGMHKIARNLSVIYNPQHYTFSKDLLDPNMFPIHITKIRSESVDYESIWQNFPNDTNPSLLSSVGHILEIRPSSISHPQAGNGVWVQSDKPVPGGTLLGFFPGVFVQKESLSKDAFNIIPKSELPYLVRWNGNVIHHNGHQFYPPYKLGHGIEEILEKLEKTNRKLPIEVLPHQINPYAVGHFINHPPKDTPANVCLIDFEIPESFFPSFLLNHLPYMKQSIRPSARPESIYAVGVISLSSLHNEELFINYGSERFTEGFMPDWLVEPPDNMPFSEYLCKEKCVYDFSRTTKMLLKWDEASMTEADRIRAELKQEQDKKIKESMEDIELFGKYYNKK